jgi:hypothetical protein
MGCPGPRRDSPGHSRDSPETPQSSPGHSRDSSGTPRGSLGTPPGLVRRDKSPRDKFADPRRIPVVPGRRFLGRFLAFSWRGKSPRGKFADPRRVPCVPGRRFLNWKILGIHKEVARNLLQSPTRYGFSDWIPPGVRSWIRIPKRPSSFLIRHCMQGFSFVHLHDGSLVYIYIYIYIKKS